MQREGIAVVDFGGQYAHLEANRIRRLGVYSELVEPERALENFRNVKGFVFSGGPSSVYEKGAPRVNPRIYQLGIPILGICYGHQLITEDLGGKVSGGKTREYGKSKLRLKDGQVIFDGLKKEETVWMSHGDVIEDLPPGFKILGQTTTDPYAAIGNPHRKIYSLQFHPEVTHTVNGMKIFENFVFKICQCEPNWTTAGYISEQMIEIKSRVGGKEVLVAASGGVDSSTAVILSGKAIGYGKVHVLLVDAFLRKNEASQISQVFNDMGISNVYVDYAERDFLDSHIEISKRDSAYSKELRKISSDPLISNEFTLDNDIFTSKQLRKVVNPEVKRWIIGKTFAERFNLRIRKLDETENIGFIVQGTLYPDFIESGSTKYSAVIKTHHNLVPAIEEMRRMGKIIEPWLYFYKDEVRKAGIELGLPREIVERHPFPGPGLAVRVLCSDGTTPENLDFFDEKIKKIAGNNSLTLPLRTVGVQGDARTYGYVACTFGQPYSRRLEKTSTEITNRIKGVNRFFQLLYPDKISSMKLRPAFLTEDRLDLAREADFVVMNILRKYNLMNKVYQFPVVLAPLSINGGEESIILRPIKSEEAMTADVAYFKKEIMNEMVDGLLKIKKIDAVIADHTKKPPGAIELE